jgi:hypothetical protein
VAGDRPVPLIVIRGIRRLGGPDSLAQRTRGVDGSQVEATELARLLAGAELGTWALGPRSIDAIVALVEAIRPNTVLEFGSGLSTIALAWAVRQAIGAGGPGRVISIEQDDDQAGRTRARLEQAGLAAHGVVLVAPLAEQSIEGRLTTCYSLPPGLDGVLAGRPVELIVVDGPAGPPGVRFGTLPLARPYTAPGTRFVLDDALRDGELAIAAAWGGLPYVKLDGIRLIEKGLLAGSVRID